MSYQPLVSKIRCHNPNKNSAKFANRSNVHYVATREGVDLSPINKASDEQQIHRYASDKEYVTYIAKRPRSHGLFGNIDTSDLQEVEQQVYQVSKSGRCIYRGIISLGEKDALALDYTTSNAWYQQMKSIMPDLAKELGANPINFTWVGAFHAEPTHPHVHYQLWDNDDRVRSFFIHPSVQKRCRNLLEKSFFTEEYEKSLQAVFEAERDELYMSKNSSRQSITDFFKEAMSIQHVPGALPQNLPPKFTTRDALLLSEKLTQLQSLLPESGRMNYQFMPTEIKKEIDKISSFLFQRPEMKTALSKYLETADQIHQIEHPSQSSISRKLAQKEIYKRTGNIILKYAFPSFSVRETIPESLLTDTLPAPSAKDEPLIPNPDTNLEQKESLAFDSFISSKAVPFEEPSSFIEGSNSPETSSPDPMLDMESDLWEAPEIKCSEDVSLSPGTLYVKWDESYKSAIFVMYNLKDFAKAISLFSLEASKGNVLAYLELAKIYERGLGTEVDEALSEKYYHYAFLGFSKLEEQEPSAYLEYRLGKLYDSGKGTTTDYQKAEKFYSLSGNKYANYSLAKLYLTHQGEFDKEPEQLLDTAKKLLKSSADQDFPYAAYEYAKLNANDSSISDPYYAQAYKGFQVLLSKREDDMLLYRLGKMAMDGKGTEQSVKKAVTCWKRAAELKNIHAQLNLAQLYLSKEYPEYQDIPTGLNLLSELSEQNNQSAQYTLGKFYLSEEYLEYQDIPKALELLHASADQGNQFAQYSLGKFYLSDEHLEYQDIPKALEMLHASADQGNQFALYSLGKFYLSDEHLEYQDIPKALEMLHASADQGNQFALYSLGKFYLSDEHLEYQDIPKALEMLHASADQGNQFALYSLGKFYLSDEHLEYQDIPKALELLHASADQGNQFAQYSLGKFYLSDEHLEYQDIPKALEMLHASADQGNQFAQYSLGKFYLSDEHLEYQDIPKALEMLHASADQGNQFAQYSLGKFYLSDEHLEYQDIPKALEMLHASADQGNQFAQYSLGKFYLSDEHLEYQDIPKALEMLHASADQENQFAQYSLGSIYLYGKYSIPKDIELGKKLLLSSAAQGNEYALNTLSHYEMLHSAPYVIGNLLYKAFFYSMMQDQQRRSQDLADKKRPISKQAQKEQHKQEEIPHL